jgi:hypothetical protein
MPLVNEVEVGGRRVRVDLLHRLATRQHRADCIRSDCRGRSRVCGGNRSNYRREAP